MIMNVQQSSFNEVVHNVGRLVGIKEIIGSKMFSKSTRSMISNTRERLEIGR